MLPSSGSIWVRWGLQGVTEYYLELQEANAKNSGVKIVCIVFLSILTTWSFFLIQISSDLPFVVVLESFRTQWQLCVTPVLTLTVLWLFPLACLWFYEILRKSVVSLHQSCGLCDRDAVYSWDQRGKWVHRRNRNSYTVLVGKPEVKNHVQELGVNLE